MQCDFCSWAQCGSLLYFFVRISILLWLFNAGRYFILTSLGKHWSMRQMNLIMDLSPLCMILTCCERCFSGWGKYLWNARCKAYTDKANFSLLNGFNAKQEGQEPMQPAYKADRWSHKESELLHSYKLLQVFDVMYILLLSPSLSPSLSLSFSFSLSLSLGFWASILHLCQSISKALCWVWAKHCIKHTVGAMHHLKPVTIQEEEEPGGT